MAEAMLPSYTALNFHCDFCGQCRLSWIPRARHKYRHLTSRKCGSQNIYNSFHHQKKPKPLVLTSTAHCMLPAVLSPWVCDSESSLEGRHKLGRDRWLCLHFFASCPDFVLDFLCCLIVCAPRFSPQVSPLTLARTSQI